MSEKSVVNLFDITGQEAGIVIREDGVMVLNWSSYDGMPYLPPYDGTECIFLPAEAAVEDLGEVEDIRSILPGTAAVENGEVSYSGMDVLLDRWFDILALFGYEVTFEDGSTNTTQIEKDEQGNQIPTSGKVFRVGETTVIAPIGWN